MQQHFRKNIIVLFVLLIPVSAVVSQISIPKPDATTNTENTKAKWISWAIFQALPVPVYTEDAGESDSRLQFGLRWNVTPVNISFNANKYVSDVQFFMVNPVRRFTGSIELFVQPEWATAGFKKADLNRFGLGIGSRIFVPVKNYGETFAASIGAKYTFRDSEMSEKNGYFGFEGGIYALYGIFGLQLNYNLDERSRYNVGLYFKFF